MMNKRETMPATLWPLFELVISCESGGTRRNKRGEEEAEEAEAEAEAEEKKKEKKRIWNGDGMEEK